MQTIRWGIIGVGDVTEVKSGPAFQKAEHSALVAVMRRNADRARDYAERHNVPKWYDNADDLIHDPEVDAGYIATPPDFHAEYTYRVAGAGKPVYVEKPMARTFSECRSMIDACAHVPLFVAYYRRALPRFLKIKELLDSGVIGEVRHVHITLIKSPDANLDPQQLPWRVLPDVAGGGLFVDLAAHTLDFLDYALGPIRSACGYASNQAHLYPADDIVSGSFAFESGVQGTGFWCFTGFQSVDQTDIIGAAGQISFSSFDTSPIRLQTASGYTEFVIDNPLHIQQPLIQLIVNDLNGLGPAPSTGETAARTSWVMDQIMQKR